MFRAIRSWWTTAKARHLIGLFAFEFVVVVLGVLTAQAVANWSRDRAAHRDMLAAKALADAQIARMAATAIAYQRTIPCMEERMAQLMRAASGDGTIDPKWLERPLLWQFPYTNLSDESMLQLRDRSSGEVADRYLSFVQYSGRARELNYLLSNDWQALKIINPDAGRVGAEDRQEARILASRIWSTLRNMNQVTKNIGYRAHDLGIAPRLDPRLRLPRGCNDLWRWNSIVYDPEDHQPAGDRQSPKS